MNIYAEIALEALRIWRILLESQTPAQRTQGWDRFFAWMDENDANAAQVKAFFAQLVAEIKK